MIIVGLDPGGTTGWAVCKVSEEPKSMDDKGKLKVETTHEFTAGQVGPEDHHLALWNFLADRLYETNDLHLVVENFLFRQGDAHRTGTVLVSLEYIGVAQLFADTYPDKVKMTRQTPASAKSFVTDSKIKRLDLWIPGKPHAMDALRHVIFYQVNRLHDYTYIDNWR